MVKVIRNFLYINFNLIKYGSCLLLIKYIFAFRGQILRINIDSSTIYFRKGTPDLKVALSSLLHEYECLRLLYKPDFCGNIVDAGGYIGTSAIALHKLYPKAKIFVIEPSIENLGILKI